MQSLKSHLVALYLRHTRKKAFASPEALNQWIARARLTQDHRPPARLSSAIRIGQRTLCGHIVYEVTPKAMRPERTIVYFHGGAFCFEITSYHWHLIAELSERLGARMIVPIYPLAPEAGFEEIFGFAMAVCASEGGRRDLVLMGDSAGGNMAVVLTMMAAERGLPRPFRHVLISPGLDMTLENPETQAMEASDPWLGIPGGMEAIRLYAGGLSRFDWRVSPILGDLSLLPPTLILAGARDMLTPDTIRFAQKAKQAGVDVEIDVAPGMIHVWPLIDMPEARTARDRIVAYLEKAWNAEPVSARQPSRSSPW
jgi:acetyl esterase/lipase